MGEAQNGCVKPAKGPLGPRAAEVSSGANQTEGSMKMVARVGKSAPDFEANAYVDGAFRNIKLSDYKGQWVTLCFYPGDFTFV